MLPNGLVMDETKKGFAECEALFVACGIVHRTSTTRRVWTDPFAVLAWMK
jgi:hypothetical protein